VTAKGFEQPITLCDVLGIGGPHKLTLYQSSETLAELTDPIPFACIELAGDLHGEDAFKGYFTKLSPKRAEARFERVVSVLSNLKIRLVDRDGQSVDGALYGKVVSTGAGDGSNAIVHFTSMSRDVESLLKARQTPNSADDFSPPRAASNSDFIFSTKYIALTRA
jgi:hypothetical protein